MSWNLFEKLKFGAKPVWLLKITANGTDYYLCSGNTDFTTVAGTPKPGDISRTWRKCDITVPEIGSYSNSSSKTVDISMALNDPLSTEILNSGGKIICDIEVFKSFRGDPNTECRTQFFGRVIQLRPTNQRLRLSCQDGSALLDNQGVNRIVQIPCPYFLYSPECGVNPALWQETAVISSGRYLTFGGDLSAFSANQFSFGRITYGTESAVILSNTTTVLNLNNEMPTLEEDLKTAPRSVTLLPGCSKTTGACVAFNNVLNYGGFPSLTKNPYDGNGIL